MEKHQAFLSKCHKIFFPIFMILTSALTGALSEMKPQPCCSVWMDGGTTLYPSTPVERAVKALCMNRGFCSNQVQLQISGFTGFSGVQKVFLIVSSQRKIQLIL